MMESKKPKSSSKDQTYKMLDGPQTTVIIITQKAIIIDLVFCCNCLPLEV